MRDYPFGPQATDVASVPALLQQWFGDGADGDVTVSGASTLTRDMYYRNLTLAAGAALATAGYRIFVSDTLDLTAAPSGAIFASAANGGNGAVATTGGVAVSLPVRTFQGTPSGLSNGGAGATGAGAVGGTQINGAIYCGGPGGQGGAGGTGNGGASAGGAGGPLAAMPGTMTPRHPALVHIGGSTAVLAVGGQSGSGGGGGGGDGTAGSGGGASGNGGGMIGIFARRINRSSANVNTGVIAANGSTGGNGGTPAAGNRGAGGGGGGGGGGYVQIICAELLGTAHVGAVSLGGGSGGNGTTSTGNGGATVGGAGGAGGKLVVHNLGLGATTPVVSDGTATTGTAPSGATGGAGATYRADI